MDKHISLEDTELKYLTIEEAKKATGLRLVLGEYPIPGPWREACKGIFYVKGIPYQSVRTSNANSSDLLIGADNSQSELIDWTAQPSHPVAIWNDERPRSLWYDQLYLAERLSNQCQLIPDNLDERTLMFGTINELAGENGLAWSQRLLMVDAPLKNLPENDESRPFWNLLGSKYGYSEDNADKARLRIISILKKIDTLLTTNQTSKNKYFLASGFSALDIYSACFIGLLKPMPPEKCPMATDFSPAYSSPHTDINEAISKRILEHRDFIYEKYLELPIVF